MAKTSTHLIAAGLALGIATAAAARAAHADDDGPIRINRPGAYALRHDIKLRKDGVAVRITADNVTLDLKGRSLVGPGGKAGIGILIASAKNVHVKNGSLSRFGFAVQVEDSRNVKIEGLQITGLDLGGPPPGEVGIHVLNSRGLEVTRNVIVDVFLGIFVRGGGSGGNRIAGNTLTGGEQGQLGVCYNPDASGSPAGPSGDLVYNNLISRFNVGIQTMTHSLGNIFRENAIAFAQKAVEELSPPGANLFEDNSSVALP
jgi:hypothetical protein